MTEVRDRPSGKTIGKNVTVNVMRQTNAKLGIARRRFTGMNVMYLVVAFPFLAGMISMAVDFGRVEVAKTQLRTATDAAARAAVSQLDPGSNAQINFTLADQQAANMFALNPLDSSTVAANGTNVVSYGYWSNGSWTGGNSTNCNAVRITASYSVPTLWATAIGSRNCTVRTTSTAIITATGGTYGVVGLQGMTMNTGVTIDSYTPSAGSYASTASSNGGIASSGNWNINGAFTVKGNLYYSTSYSVPVGGTVTGSRIPLPVSPTLASMYPAVTTPGGATARGNYNGGNLTLPSGVYYYTSFNLNPSDTLIITGGTVSIYVNGNINLNGNVNVNGTPSNCLFYNVSGSGMNIGGSGQIYCHLYGPNSPINYNTSGDFFGSMIGSQVSTGGTGRIHCDTGGSVSGGGIQIVQ